MEIRTTLKNVWNAFLGRDPTPQNLGAGSFSYYNPQRKRYLTRGNEKTIVKAIYNQISVDCAKLNVRHVRLDEEDRYKETIKGPLNDALSCSANIDQTGRAMIQDAVESMLEEGCIAIVPVMTDGNPNFTESFQVEEIRVGRVTEWFPRAVRVDLYNDRTGQHQEVILQKKFVAIVENPFYRTMNEPNSTAQRLLRVCRQIDALNDQASSGKLDIIIQLPYTIRSDGRRVQAESRRKAIEGQLTGSQYGIAYIDGTEKVIQLNRSLENNLWTQYEALQSQLYNELGFSQAIFDGTADEKTMLNYQNRTIEPIMTAITEEMARKWISKTARSQKQSIRFFNDPFKLVPVAQLAEITDKFTRNEIMSSNEFRSIIGLKPSSDPKADELINSNLNHPDEGQGGNSGGLNKKQANVDLDAIVSKISK